MSNSSTTSKSGPEKRLAAFLTAGYPDRAKCLKYMKAAAEGGADVIELGIPFSDPLADGAVIQEASEAALKRGISVTDALKLVRQFTSWRKERPVDVYLMTYVNPVLAYGIGRFMADARAAGARGVIPVDLVPEEGGEFRKAAEAAGLAVVFLCSITCSPSRMQRIAEASTGFIYLVTVKGVTGTSSGSESDLKPVIERLRQVTSTPVYLGFGIREPEQAAAYARLADGVVVGSELLRKINSGGGDRSAAVKRFVASLRKAIDLPKS